MTNGEVVAELRTRVADKRLEHDFYLISSTVGYRYLLFRAAHRLGYPVTIFDGPDGSEDGLEVYLPDNPKRKECEDATELERALKTIFEHPATQQIVGQLRSLSRETG